MSYARAIFLAHCTILSRAHLQDQWAKTYINNLTNLYGPSLLRELRAHGPVIPGSCRNQHAGTNAMSLREAPPGLPRHDGRVIGATPRTARCFEPRDKERESELKPRSVASCLCLRPAAAEEQSSNSKQGAARRPWRRSSFTRCSATSMRSSSAPTTPPPSIGYPPSHRAAPWISALYLSISPLTVPFQFVIRILLTARCESG